MKLSEVLIELMLVITILAIVTFIAFPVFTEFTARYRSKTKQWELFELLIFMRNQAYSERANFILCPKGDEDICSNNWSNGALLFIDINSNGTLDSKDKIERYFTRLPEGATLSWKGFNNKGYLIFRPDGTTPSQSGNFSYCPTDGEAKLGWIIILNSIGRPYYGRDADGDGIVENGSGDNLSCPQS
ncbi:GspH/FimT family pseudopilin [Microbulbifer sp. OS29]|uniref:Type II secretion system protein H n=1 Tax=Microbulbifer okhotskensis TaxID=2926617 RepID=A0A9X2EM80_9GAMM|nr:GspH/FimT family pseudopilin [Microbulbifer okhotskensis]MCO1334834.1 GspH/FimT family pseudopilin [Microbulbifer okhotskensis]